MMIKSLDTDTNTGSLSL